VVAFALCLGAWLAVRFHYTRSIVVQGSQLLAIFAPGMEARNILSVEGGKFYVATGVEEQDGTMRKMLLDQVHVVGWTSVYFLWLVVLTSWRRLRRAWWYIFLAFVLLWLSQVAFFSLNTAKDIGILHLQRFGESFLSQGTLRFLDFSCRAYFVSLHHMVPFVLYAPTLLFHPENKPAWSADADHKNPSRNAPCPCGSGEKFKRCCGK
jgi:hypothetical protein